MTSRTGSARILPQDFYQRDALALARDLLGKTLVHRHLDGLVAGRIVEVEAYCGPEDRAAHSYGGRRTARNESMWGRGGRAYVYFVYGMHYCMNVVGGEAGKPDAVLLRALEPLEGLDILRSNRGTRVRDEHLLRGPANLCRSMGIDRGQDGATLLRGDLVLRDAPKVPASSIRRTPRIGVDYAGEHAKRPWRIYVAGSPAVSGPAALRTD